MHEEILVDTAAASTNDEYILRHIRYQSQHKLKIYAPETDFHKFYDEVKAIIVYVFE